MPTLDPAHASRIASAIDMLNQSSAAGLSPLADALAILDSIEALQSDLRDILEAERRRRMLAVAN